MSISFTFSSFVEYRFQVWSDDSLDFLSVWCYVPLLISDYVNLDFLYFSFGFFWEGFVYIVDILQKKQLFVPLTLCIVFFVSILLISVLNLIIPCHLLLLCEFAVFIPQFSRVLLDCSVRFFSGSLCRYLLLRTFLLVLLSKDLKELGVLCIHFH